MAKKDKEIELTQTQKEIIQRRKRINRRDLEEEKIKPFARYKVLTYLFIFLMPPYGLYRVHKKGSPFTYTEKWAQTIVAIVYVSALFDVISKAFK